MIQDDALASRLNAVKKGKEIPPPPAEDVYFKKPHVDSSIESNNPSISNLRNNAVIFAATIYNLTTELGISILFGIGVKTIFSTSWNFWGILGVGILIRQTFNLISRLKLFK